MTRRLLDILCCPITHARLEPLGRSRLHALNRRIRDGSLRYRNGRPVGAELTEAWVTADGRLAYAVRDGVPVLLPEEGINLSQLDAG